MAELSPALYWDIRLTAKELVLLLKALGNRAMTENERLAADALGDKLTELRANGLREFERTAERLTQALDDKRAVAEGRP